MTSRALFQQAMTLHSQGRLAEADAIYRRLLADAPADFQLQYRLALSLFQQQRHAEALAMINAALAFHPRQTEALMLRGTLLASSGRREEALADFDQVLKEKPGLPGALFNRAQILSEMERRAEAVGAFDRFLALVPDSVEAWLNRGAALQGLGRSDGALASYERALKHNSGHGLAWLNRGILHKELGDFQRALESFDKATALMPRHAGAWRGRGSALIGLRKFDEALKSLDHALEIVPGEPDTIRERNSLLKAMRLFADQPANANMAEVWHHRAAFLQVQQRLQDALEALDQSLASDPDYLPTLLTRGQILTELGRTEDGMTSYRRHAEAAYGGKPFHVTGDPPHKQSHDQEQRAYLAGQGFRDGGFHLDVGARVSVAVNPANAEDVAKQWRQTDPQIAVIDNLLTAEALEGLRRFCRASTMWRRPYKNGYLGAMPEYGFACPLLAQIADELRTVFPGVIGDHALRFLWGFKYDSRLSGIPMHADQAAVNVNFWIAPEEANRDPASGGLMIWPVKPPPDWHFDRYNKDEAAIRAYMAKEGAEPVVVPHRANRAVVFDSDLFHETDRIDFADGYLNRRINVTMLYGRRSFHGS
ncbi:MAG TPA: tetratricopeptide repeat protein [Rhizomicrobium sp.]|jgi:tetratricopeptide (TPR) repeat protein|nr:tetratricopeptide repeat protein [Rhizomicrobium sp.]